VPQVLVLPATSEALAYGMKKWSHWCLVSYQKQTGTTGRYYAVRFCHCSSMGISLSQVEVSDHGTFATAGSWIDVSADTMLTCV